MSASDTNLEKQKRRHRPSLVAIGAALTAVVVVIVALVVWGGVAREDQAAPGTVEQSQ